MLNRDMNEFIEFDSFFKKIKEESTRRCIIIVEYMSIVLTLLCCVLSAYLAYNHNSMTALAVSIDSLLDILAYMIVIWRYMRIHELNSTMRDRRALFLLSLLFFVSAFCIEFESMRNLVNGEKPVASVNFIAISVVQSIVFSCISISKFFLANKIEKNSTLISSAINSLVASLSNFSMAIGMSLFVFEEQIWYLDSIFGLIIGVLVFVYGCQLFITNISFMKCSDPEE